MHVSGRHPRAGPSPTPPASGAGANRLASARPWPSLALAATLLLASGAPARSAPDETILPDFEPTPAPAGRVLPPPPAAEDDFERLLGGRRLHVRRFRLLDSTVFDQAEIDRLSADYRNRAIGFAELEALRERLSRAYIERGYITSGVLLPSQVVEDGSVEFRAVEGRLDQVRVDTDGRIDPAYFEQRIRASAAPLIRVERIEQRLHRFQQEPAVASVRASLRPGSGPGLADLELAVEERPAGSGSVRLDNHTTPSLGAEGVRLDASWLNPRGRGDRLDADLRLTEGLQEFGVLYSHPVSLDDARLELYVRASESDIVDSNFADLDIESEAQTLGLRWVQPVYRLPGRQLEVSAGLDLRRSESFLLGEAFSFSEGPIEGVSELSVLRFGADWLRRDQRQVAAARLQLSLGLDALGATRHDDDRPDGEFGALLGQVQWVRRWDWMNTRLILRGELQHTDDRLLGMEQYSLGGHASVRGYREHQVVRDRGLFASAELRLAVWNTPARAGFADLAVFADAGEADNRGSEESTATLSSLGLGLLGRLGGTWQYALYWADRRKPIASDRDYDLQDDGVHFMLSYRWPGMDTP